MTGQVVTTNPVTIMIINMTIVFGVLWILGYIIRLLYIIDPTRKKTEPAPAVVAAPPVAAAVQPAEVGPSQEDKTLVAIMTTAIMAYGYQNVKVKSIKKV